MRPQITRCMIQEPTDLRTVWNDPEIQILTKLFQRLFFRINDIIKTWIWLGMGRRSLFCNEPEIESETTKASFQNDASRPLIGWCPQGRSRRVRPSSRFYWIWHFQIFRTYGNSMIIIIIASLRELIFFKFPKFQA